MEIIALIKFIGILGVLGMVFAESGLFFGFIFPGDSLLFSAGFLASQGLLDFWPLLVFTPLAAILGDNVGYWFGRKIGPKIFSKEDSFFFNKKYVDKTRAFYDRHGKKTIILARFVPIVRTFAPILAGVGGMNYKAFMSYNIFGGIFWSESLLLLGYFLGNLIPDIGQYILPIIILIVLVSFGPFFAHLFKKLSGKV